MVRSFQLTLTTAAQRLSNVYTGTALNADPTPALDIPYREIQFSAETAVGYVGENSSVSTTVYGSRVEIATTTNGPVKFGPYSTGPLKLSQFWAAGNTCVLHITAIPF